MKCYVCKQADTTPGTTTVTLERAGLTLVFKGVPAEVCRNCGEAYVDERVSKELLETAEREARSGTQFEIRQFAVA